jgi:hypothetical protein
MKMRRSGTSIALSVWFSVLASGCAIAVDKGEPVDGPIPDAMAIEQGISKRAQESLWPGFEPKSVPLAIFDGKRTYLFRHPSPPDGYSPLAGYPNSFSKDGRDAAITANTNVELGGEGTATLLLNPEHPLGSVNKATAVAVHEAFHVYQRAHHASWVGNEADLFTYPLDDPELLSLRRQETLGLRFALNAKNAKLRNCWIRTTLNARAKRFAGMDATFAAYERGTELNEGLATYVQHRVEGSTTVDVPEAGYPLKSVRLRAYTTGLALAVLLDETYPGWTALLEKDDKQTLDGMLSEVVHDGGACPIDSDAMGQIERRAKQDVVALKAERIEALAKFSSTPGWRVKVIAVNGQPLWPQGFDPLNLELLAQDRILHSRFVKLGNDSGRVETLGPHALTVAAGKHPLFEGVHSIEVVGLPSEPKVHVSGTAVSIVGDGVELNFKDAVVRQIDKTTIVALRSAKEKK